MANTSDRGLGSPNMSEEEKQKIQSMGGKASPAKFEQGSSRARKAGRKGGQARSNNSES
jgi:general stress protein YciG